MKKPASKKSASGKSASKRVARKAVKPAKRGGTAVTIHLYVRDCDAVVA